MSTLAEDFKSCRKRLNISLEDISKSTRVPVSLFASIEDGTFFTNPSFTRTYIRSFVRMYGKAIKLDESDIVRVLDEDEAEMYSGFLYKKYVLGEVETPIIVPTIPDVREPKLTPKTEPTFDRVAEPTPAKPEPQRTPIESDRTVDWADMNAKIYRPKQHSSNTTYLLLALLVIVISALAIYFGYNPSDSTSNADNFVGSQNDVTPELLAPVDTLSQDRMSLPAQMLALPDTLKIIVYALNDKLDPVRISSDLKDRVNPYWLERGAGRSFEFRDTIMVRADPKRFALIYNGHLISNFREFRFDEDSLNIRLTRSMLMQRSESQRPGSLPDNVRPPILDF
jgi:hypothetical protein